MQTTSTVPRAASAVGLHHVAVLTPDLDASLAWYEEFFGSPPAWRLDTFSEVTRSRLPGITRLAELRCGGLCLHLTEWPGLEAAGSPTTGVQHLCVTCPGAEDLAAWRRRWLDVFDRGRHRFASAERPTEIVTDADGVRSFYCRSIEGLELEFTWIPEGVAR